MSTFDPHLEASGGVNLFTGEFISIQCIDPALTFAPLSQANLVMDGSKSFNIDLEWQLTGPLVPIWLDEPYSNGRSWSVEAYAESVGPGPEIQITAQNVRVDSVPLSHDMTYKSTLVVSPGTLPEGNPGPGGPSGLYKIVCSCFLNFNLGTPGYDVSGYMEGPIIRIENPL